jgi:hypothetical protein
MMLLFAILSIWGRTTNINVYQRGIPEMRSANQDWRSSIPDGHSNQSERKRIEAPEFLDLVAPSFAIESPTWIP